MHRRSLGYNWTEEDRLTCAKWRRGVAIFYGCMAFIVLGLIALSQSSNVAPDVGQGSPSLVHRLAE